MAERRYNEDEVAAIFKTAAEQQQAATSASSAGGPLTPLASSQGMTLAQLQDIGREVGIPADMVARAAGALDRLGEPTVRRFLGFPIGVGRTVDLGRKLTDAEWERLVVDLRETFDARGRLKEEGSFRQWTNGNLQALLEPTASGHRLRLKTIKGEARPYLIVGLSMIAVTAYALLRGASGASEMSFALLGLGLIGWMAIRLPGWARERRHQMEEIALRLTSVSPEYDHRRRLEERPPSRFGGSQGSSLDHKD
jgi:hypothetical protein